MICDKCGNLLNESGVCPNCNKDNNVQLENSSIGSNIEVNDSNVVPPVVEVQQIGETNTAITNEAPVVSETPVVEPVPVVEPQPVIEQPTEIITTNTESAPVVQTQQVETNTAITSEAPVVSETPVIEPVPVVEPQPVIEQPTETITTNTESAPVVQTQQVETNTAITNEVPVVSETPVIEPVPVVEPAPVVEQPTETITTNIEGAPVVQTQQVETNTTIANESPAVNIQQNLEQSSKSSSKKLIFIFAGIIGFLLIVFIILLILKPWVKDEDFVDKETGSIKDAYENVNGMFNEAKKNTFVTEVQKYMDTSKTGFVQQALMRPAQSIIFSNIDDAVDYYDALRLDIDENDKKYYIEMDRHGNFVRVLVYDGVACYDTDSIDIDMDGEQFEKYDVNVNDVYEGNKNDSLYGCYNAN